VTSAKRPSGATVDQFVFRPRTGLVACALWAALAVVWLAIELPTGWASAAARLPLIGAISTVVYAVFYRPRVIVSGDDVLVVNVIRDIDIPFRALADVQTQYALTLTTVDGRRFQAWAAPASGRIGASRVTEEERKTLSWNGSMDEIPASASLRSDAGAAAVAIRRRWQPPSGAVLPVAGAASIGDDIPTDGLRPDGLHSVRIRWASRVLLVFAVFAAGALVVAFS
jgi:hypothetical protein